MLLMNPKRHASTVIMKLGPKGLGPDFVSSEASDPEEALMMAAEDVTRAMKSDNGSEFLASFKRFHSMLHAMETETDMESEDDYED